MSQEFRKAIGALIHARPAHEPALFDHASDINAQCRVETPSGRLSGVSARVADHPGAVDFIIDRVVHVTVNPQGNPRAVHQALRVAGERGGQKPDAVDQQLLVVENVDIGRSAGLQMVDSRDVLTVELVVARHANERLVSLLFRDPFKTSRADADVADQGDYVSIGVSLASL